MERSNEMELYLSLMKLRFSVCNFVSLYCMLNKEHEVNCAKRLDEVKYTMIGEREIPLKVVEAAVSQLDCSRKNVRIFIRRLVL